MYEAISAGHLCLDIIPEFFPDAERAADVFVPGRLIKTGKALFSTGGSVGNTGLALTKLGVNTALVARLGRDALGVSTLDALKQIGGDPSHVSMREGEDSSYTMVLAPKGIDRIFLHCAAANDRFTAEDVDFAALKGAKLFHLGYPTAMRAMAEGGGAALREILKRAKDAGMTTSLDFSYPDAEMIGYDWRKIFECALPYADMVFPSVEELLMMLDRPAYDRLRALDPDVLKHLEIDALPALGTELLSMGAAVAAIKCGTRGYYLKVAGEERLAAMGVRPADPAAWADEELFSHIYCVDTVKSASGAGDTSIAGFLAAFLRGHSARTSLNAACATGAICVTAYNATDALLPLDSILKKVEAGWQKRPYDAYAGEYFRHDKKADLLVRK